MAFHRYQVNFNESGVAQTPILLPDEPEPKKRTIIVREKTSADAKRAAERLYSLAE